MNTGWLILTRFKILFIPLATFGLFISFVPSQQKEKVIQIDIKSMLNGRAVTVINKGKLISWNKGVDRDNGYLTAAAAIFNKETGLHALPDNALIIENASHPEVLLHYSNDNMKDNQVLCVADSGGFAIPVPQKHYQTLFLSMTSAYGSSSLQVEMAYENGTETKKITLPDWYNDIAEDDKDVCYIVHNLGKWDQKNGLTEKDHHNIDAVILHPDVKSVLKSVKIVKGKAGYLLFWAATGVAE